MPRPSTAEHAGSSPPRNFGFDDFFDQFGEKSGFERSVLSQIWTDAKSEYGQLAFHNFRHVKESLWEAMSLADLCQANEVEVNRRDLIVALLFHDAGYHEPLDTAVFLSKEERSASIMADKAPSYGYNAAGIKRVKKLIMVTKSGEKPTSLEERIMVRSDIANVGTNLQTFLTKGALLMEEYFQLQGTRPDYGEYMSESLGILAGYAENDLSLGDFDRLGWQQRVITNLASLLTELAGMDGISETRKLRRIGNAALSKLLGNKFGDSENQK